MHIFVSTVITGVGIPIIKKTTVSQSSYMYYVNSYTSKTDVLLKHGPAPNPAVCGKLPQIIVWISRQGASLNFDAHSVCETHYRHVSRNHANSHSGLSFPCI